MKILKYIISPILILFIGVGGGWYGTMRGWDKQIEKFFGYEQSKPKKFPESADLSLFWTVWGILGVEYINESALDPQKMVYGAIKGMVDAVGDSYTVFMDPTETDEFTKNLDEELEGIGAELTVTDGKLVVVTPLKDSPAEKAGIKSGDVIYKIEDKFAADMSLFDAVKAIRGEAGTPVKLSLIREKVTDPIEVTVIRAKLDINSVERKDLGNGIIYIGISQFSNNTAEEFGKAVSDLILKEPKGLIIDVRNNGGGYLDAAVKILSYLLDKDVSVVETRQKDSAQNEVLKTSGGPKLSQVPLIMLVNEGSASASEIAAGAIQDNKRGIIMGTKTFGKGTVQAVEYLDDGSSIRLTIAEWFTPKGRAINHVGITPDIVVDLYDDDVKKGFDRQLDEATKYLENLKK